MHSYIVCLWSRRSVSVSPSPSPSPSPASFSPLVLRMSHFLTPSIVDEGLARCDAAIHPEQVGPPDDDLALKADDVQQVDKTNHLSTPNDPSPVSGSPAASIRDSASMHSLPAVQVTEPQDSHSLPQTPDVLSDDDTPVAQRIVESSSTTSLPSRRRTLRSRPIVDVRCMLSSRVLLS